MASGVPEVYEFALPVDPRAAFRAVRHLPHCLVLESVLRDDRLGRYSYIVADPVAVIRDGVDGLSACEQLDRVEQALRRWQTPFLAELPAFQGGAAGFLSYELGRELERIPPPRASDFPLPRVALGLYDVVIAFDHQDGRTWIVSQGFHDATGNRSPRRAHDRLQQFRDLLEHPTAHGNSTTAFPAAQVTAIPESPHDVVVPPHRLRGELYSNFTPQSYRQTVVRAMEYIAAGDIFQVNIAQRLLYRATSDAASLYERLHERNPATFAGYFDLGDRQIISASPERFLSLRDGVVETRPIKGTRRRAAGVEADLFVGDDLRSSEKDRAENVMIVDLMRNDLSRVCQPDSVCVTQLCRVETYRFVQHLVSAVIGRLRPHTSGLDLLRATFPGGSITGAPKIRAMEIIAELEPHARGAYCGSLGYWSCHGDMDWNILIRTITAADGWWQIPVGGGIVTDSDPQREYEETWHKAEGLLRSLDG